MSRYTAFITTVLFSFTLQAQLQLGLTKHDGTAAEGYILFAPLNSKTTYLMDRCGRQVHSWKSQFRAGQSAYLLPNGNLLRCANDTTNSFYSAAGRIEQFDWNGNLLWSYGISTPTSCLHHDVWPMPNGNILALLWEKKTTAEAVALGRRPDATEKYVWMEKIIELKPRGKNEATLVWEWNVCDHLVQDVNPALANYGNVANSPQLINVNYNAKKEEDWLHFNSITYNEELDQVLVSNRNFCEFYILDHSTTTAEAAGHQGGHRNKGGDILYRWGNPAAYNCGTTDNKQFYWQHTVQWIPKGLNDGGKIIVFNNGTMRKTDVPYSTVEIIEPPVDEKGNYKVTPGEAFLPAAPYWNSKDVMWEKFYSLNVSSAQRLSNGNLLICEGAQGRFFELNPQGKIVWNYVSPVTLKGIVGPDTKMLENQVFRCTLYDPGYSAFKRRKLVPGSSIGPVYTAGPCVH